MSEFSVPKLDSQNFIEQVIGFGYFSEQFPSCFSSKTLAEKFDKLPDLPRCNSLPATISIHKDDVSRRTISLPNPAAFLRLARLMQKNWETIQKFASSPNSLSPITYIHYEYNDSETVKLNSEKVRDTFCSKSDYVEGIRKNILISQGYKYQLKVDIANCYNTIYTHSIAWAICGKTKAKKYHQNIHNKQSKKLDTKYNLANELDKCIREQKCGESNGIVVGPFTSRIFSEIVLAAIDKELTEKGYIFRRYVDDYKFYFRSEEKAKVSVPTIEKVLNEYNLYLNSAKTVISYFPYEVISNMKEAYEEAEKNNGVFGILNKASQLYMSGEKGAYKYALKYIKNKKPSQDDFDVIVATLINILLIEPKYALYVTRFLKEHFRKPQAEIISKLINKELRTSINEDLQQETLVFLNIVKELELTLNGKNLIEILRSSNDFAIIIGLDIWKNRNEFVNRTETEERKIHKALEDISNELKSEKYTGARWLLLYEIKFHHLMDDNLIPVPNNDENFDKFFNELYNNQVSFYKSVKQN